ncbi:MAG: hypothetical protein HN617_08830 [Planctomycetaceae bacterium]|jgi:uncharacterized protein (TIGR03000 family)|nr:hypothetical protein [Planctomycetaceae bacterium]MBT4726452.1 hypothetical protein [Planctomycetaceae bacterium]MBT4844242.1 hypothetical protein [Planctomycetaceae bacterium]MBT5125357.1 hypothetical protein [Planctomycetaceae bacterium]MBT5600434.1 hypothetical protein [Planctomycetaceae bacterium]
MRQSIFATIVIVILFTASQTNAGNVLVNPCCSRVVVCCGPTVVYHRPILRNAIFETRLALHYHANYRYYRAPLFGPLLAPRIYSRVYYSSPVIVSDAKPTVAKSKVKPAPNKYINQPKASVESRLVPIQPTAPTPVAPSVDGEPAAPGNDDEPKLEQPGKGDEDGDFKLPQPEVKVNPTSTTLHLQVPHDAQVTINGFRTSTKGTSREYISSNLDPANTYQYDIEIVWNTTTGIQRQRKSIQMMPGNVSSLNVLLTAPSQLVKK